MCIIFRRKLSQDDSHGREFRTALHERTVHLEMLAMTPHDALVPLDGPKSL